MKRKVIIIGIDGMDPLITENLMDQGRLPHFTALARTGYYSRCQTLNPPQSPVVWASIATGVNPGEHGVFDFLHREPKTYLPRLALLHLDKASYQPVLHAPTFWEKAGDRGYTSVILRWPGTFPPRPFRGKVLAGLGVPDIKGHMGLYSFFTNDLSIDARQKKGAIIQINPAGGSIETKLAGPMVASFTGAKEAGIPLRIELRRHGVDLCLPDSVTPLKEKTWSSWIPVTFKLGFRKQAHGFCKFYLQSITPKFNLFATPVHVTPGSPHFPISAPLNYAQHLSQIHGLFGTLGMPEDTNGLNDELLEDGAFLQLCRDINQEREKIFFYELGQFQEGILACVFDTTDRVQHMFWRLRDETHPRYDAVLAEQYGTVIEDYYVWMDGIVGEILKRISGDTLLMILSDHGFTSFNKEVHLNTWLVRNGFMTLCGEKSTGGPLFEDVDWSRTTAYSLGLNSIYLNVKEREGEGILSAEDLPLIKSRLAQSLRNMRDQGVKAIHEVYDTREIYHGPQMGEAPDLVVGYAQGYRASWQTALGAAPPGEVIAPNLQKWSGDHCCDREFVPGVCFANHRMPHLEPSVSSFLGLIEEMFP